MLNAIGFDYFWGWKKKADFIIPASFFYHKNPVPVPETSNEVSIETDKKAEIATEPISITPALQPELKQPEPSLNSDTKKVSALSIASIRAKKEMTSEQDDILKEAEKQPNETFTETDMLLHWDKFTTRLKKQGKMLMATYMNMNVPRLENEIIFLELPNESTKEEFLSGCHELMAYLKSKLNNHSITVEVIVNESVEKKYAFTPLEKYEKLKEINPALELLRTTFDLDI